MPANVTVLHHCRRCLPLVLSVAVLLSGCDLLGTDTDVQSQGKLNIGLALGEGGLGDKGYNDSAYTGIETSPYRQSINLKVVSSKGSGTIDVIRSLAEKRYEYIIGLGTENAKNINALAKDYQDVRFVAIDSVIDDQPNVFSVVFDESEGDFLAGALAARASKSNTIAFLGGAKIDMLVRIQKFWEKGAYHANPDVKILAAYAGSSTDFSAFSNTTAGYTLANKLFDQGADILYVAAGRTGLGAIEAARERGKLLITTSVDQRHLAPENIISSRTKNLANVTAKIAADLSAGKWTSGVVTLGMRDKAIGLAPLDGAGLDPPLKKALVSASVQAYIEDLKQQLIGSETGLSLLTGDPLPSAALQKTPIAEQ